MKKSLIFLSLLALPFLFSSNNEINHKQKAKKETLKSDKHLENVLSEIEKIFINNDVNNIVANPATNSKLEELNWKNLSHEEIIFNCNKKLMEITE